MIIHRVGIVKKEGKYLLAFVGSLDDQRIDLWSWDQNPKYDDERIFEKKKACRLAPYELDFPPTDE